MEEAIDAPDLRAPRRGWRRRIGAGVPGLRPSPAPRGVDRHVLRQLPQPATAHRRTRPRTPESHHAGRQHRGVGESDREAARRLDAAARPAAPGHGDLSRGRPVALEHEIDRAWEAQSRSRTHRRRPSAQSRRIQQRGSRPVRARSAQLRREVAAARRRDRRRQLRQLRRRRCRSRPRIWSATCRWRARSRGWRSACRRRARASRRSRFRCTSMQDDRQSEDLPLGSRGGMAIRHDFPGRRRVSDQGPSAAAISGLPQGHGLAAAARRAPRRQAAEALHGRRQRDRAARGGQLRGRRRARLRGRRFVGEVHAVGGDAGLEVRVPVAAGPHVVGVSFVRELWEPEGLPQPLQRGRVIANDQVYMDYANVGSVQIGGPYARPASARPTRRAGARSSSAMRRRAPTQRAARRRILSRMARLAYRRPVTSADVQTLLEFFDSGTARRRRADFDAGIQFALERMLVDPDFLLRVSPRSEASATVGSRQSGSQQSARSAVHRLSDLEVASRLSFFLWSSIPDEHLLSLAERGQLTNPPVLEKEVRRMLADPRAIDALVGNFAAQWLNLRRVEEVVVDPERYPNYDLSLLQAFQRETELFVGSTIREDRSVADLLNADYTFVNERLARHYGIPGIYGSRFRRVDAAGSRSARRAARRRRAAGDDVVSGSHVAGAARQVAAEQHLRLARAAASAGRRHQPREQAGRGAGVDARAAGAAPAESVVQQLPRRDRSARVRARELRRDRRLADGRRIGQAGRRQRRDGRAATRSTGSPACARCCSPIPSSFRAR